LKESKNLTFVDQWDIIAFRKDRRWRTSRKKAGPQRRRGLV